MTPLEILAEWEKGCANTPHRGPEQCASCTRTMVKKLRQALTKEVASSALERVPGGFSILYDRIDCPEHGTLVFSYKTVEMFRVSATELNGARVEGRIYGRLL